MTKSYKMLVLLAMLNEDAFPGSISIDALADAVRALASRNARLLDDLGPKAKTAAGLKSHLEQNPIEAWTAGRGTGGTPYFAYDGQVFRTTFETGDREALQELTREIAEWRLAEYLARLDKPANALVCKGQWRFVGRLMNRGFVRSPVGTRTCAPAGSAPTSQPGRTPRSSRGMPA